MKPEACLPIREELAVSAEMMEHHIRSRRSIRTYRKKPVERETLRRLIETARYGPTAKNFQTVKWLVVENREKVNRLASMVIDWMRAMLKGEVTPIFTPFMMAFTNVNSLIIRATGLIVAFLIGSVVKSQRSRVQTGVEGMIGLRGTAPEKFSPRDDHYEGQVSVRGEIWRATSQQPITSGQEITVEDLQGLTLLVSGNGSPSARS